MFDPCGKAKITMEQADGTICELDGYVRSMQVESGDGPTMTTLEMVGMGEVALQGDFVPEPPPAATLQRMKPRAPWADSTGNHPTVQDIIDTGCRDADEYYERYQSTPEPAIQELAPWTWEAWMLAIVVPWAAAVWGILRVLANS